MKWNGRSPKPPLAHELATLYYYFCYLSISVFQYQPQEEGNLYVDFHTLPLEGHGNSICPRQVGDFFANNNKKTTCCTKLVLSDGSMQSLIVVSVLILPLQIKHKLVVG